MTPRSRHELAVLDLHHRFGDQIAADGVTFRVASGEVVGLVGKNGAGKTTTMRAVMGILVPQSGSITWDGDVVRDSDRRHFGYMPEERGLYPQMRLLDQLVYLGRLHGLDLTTARERASSWIGRLGLAGRANDKVVALSHGNQQRAQLAAAVVHEPPLMVLDEPFAGLDPEAVDVLTEVLRTSAKEGAAILFSSHQLDLVERACDRVVILADGRVLADGTLSELSSQFPQMLRVHVHSAEPWTPQIAGVTVIASRPDGVLLDVAPGVDPQLILHDAQGAGAVDHFAFETGDLDELFRRLVAS